MQYFWRLKTENLPTNKHTRRIILRAFLIPSLLLFALWIIIFSIRTVFRKGPDQPGFFQGNTAFGLTIPGKYAVFGIDVSHHQGSVNWSKVKEMVSNNRKVTFVFIKATEGITRQDQNFEENWEAVRKEGFIRGAYHFFYPSRDAGRQAENFISQVSLSKGDLPPVIDIEHTNGRTKKQICEGLKAFIDEIEAEYDVKPIIYTNISYYNNYLSDDFADYPLWISGYHGEDKFREKFKSGWHFWQYSEDGQVDGIKGEVDCNVFKGSESDLQKMCIR